MERILDSWTSSYFVEPLLFIVLLFGVQHSLSFRRVKGLWAFAFYFSLFLTLFLVDYVYKGFFYPDYYKSHFLPFQLVGNYAAAMVELFTFFFFFRSISKSPFHIKIYNWLAILFFLFSLYLPFHHSLFQISAVRCLHFLYVIEQGLLFSFCVLYFLEFTDDPNFRKSGIGNEFWVSASLLLYSLITLPLTLLSNYLYNTDYNFYINSFAFIDFFYILLILAISRIPGRARYTPP